MVKIGLQQPHAAGADRRNADRHADRDPPASGHEAAQQRDHAAFAIFRDEALRGGAEPEIDRLSEQHHPGPDIDVDAELERAHPAGEQHLGAESEHRAGDADQEHGAGKPLHHQMFGVAEPHLEARPPTGQRRARRKVGRVFGAGESQASLRSLRPPSRPRFENRGLARNR
jgi:hypothetical protein